MHARDIMASRVVSIAPEATVLEAIELMLKNRISGLPVMRGRELVGIVSRASLLHALATMSRDLPPPAKSDAEIRHRVTEELAKQPWAPIALIDVVVKDGVVELWGSITEASQGEALRVCAENIPGVKAVVSHLSWIEPMSGLVISEEDMPKGGAPSAA